MAQHISQETQTDALKAAKAIQKPGQTKEQTKLIAQGIEKGISEYKKQQKMKARERDKLRKQQLKNKSVEASDNQKEENVTQSNSKLPFAVLLPWVLLAASWGVFIFLS